jgi:hypothetical protein
VSNGGKFKLYTVLNLNGLLFPTLTQAQDFIWTRDINVKGTIILIELVVSDL